jgi:hypothetical protein
VDEPEEGLGTLVGELSSSKIGRRDELEEGLMPLGRERTFIERVDELEERLRHLDRETSFFKDKGKGRT